MINLPVEMKNAAVFTGDFRDLRNGVKVENPAHPFLPFKIVMDGDQTIMVSAKQNNGDWDYWFVITAQDWQEAIGEDDAPKYNVTLSVVSPQAAGLRNVIRALKGCGPEKGSKKHSSNLARQLMLVEVLSQYGLSARLTDDYGNNRKELLKTARKEAFKARSLFGFYLDRQQNAIGDTGWDFVRGNVAGSRDRDHAKYLKDHGLTEDAEKLCW